MNGQDREQFREFMVSRWPELVRLGYALTGDRRLAEDLAQTALAGACTAWWRVSRADDPDAYLRKILINASNRRFPQATAARGGPRAARGSPRRPRSLGRPALGSDGRAAGAAAEATRRYSAALLGGPERRARGRHARVLGGHDAQPGVAGAGQAAGERGPDGRGSRGDEAGWCPLKLTDDAALRRRLHEEIDLSEIGPAPVEAVFRRYRTVRARQWAAIASGMALIAVVPGVLMVRGPGQPGGATSRSSGRPNPVQPSPRRPVGVYSPPAA